MDADASHEHDELELEDTDSGELGPSEDGLPGWSPIDEKEGEGIEDDQELQKLLQEVQNAHDTQQDAEWEFDVGAPGGTMNPNPSDVNLAEEQMMLGKEPDPEDKKLVGTAKVLLAGFRAEELPRVRLLIDELGGSDVPVVPLTSAMLYQECRSALHADEPDWSSERPHWVVGGGDGSERSVLFIGLDAGERSEVISQLERIGLPRIASNVVYYEDLQRSVGELLSDALRQHRQSERHRLEARRQKEVASLSRNSSEKLHRASYNTGNDGDDRRI